jgi:hypothetical protein
MIAPILARRVAAGFWFAVLLTGAGQFLLTRLQFLLTRLSSGNGIDITTAIWSRAGRLPALRTRGVPYYRL